MKYLDVSMVQIKTIDGNVMENFKHTSKFLERNKLAIQNSDVMVMPELWATGFSKEAIEKYASKLENSEIVEFIMEISRKYDVNVVTTVPERESNKIFNTAVIVYHDEIIAKYRKVHLFKMFGEDKVFSNGTEITVANVEGVNVGLAICYDLRFPEVFRAEALKGAEVYLVSSAWGKKRTSHWRILAKARALENQAYFIGVNRVGESSIVKEEFSGESIVVSPWGTVVAKLSSVFEEVRFVRLNLGFLRKIRAKMPFLKDAVPENYCEWFMEVSQPPPQH